MLDKLLKWLIENWEQTLTSLATTIITISVVMQRTKINRRLKSMQKNNDETLKVVELTTAEYELVQKYREEHKKEVQTNELYEIKRIADSLTEEVLRNYKLVKSGINFLKQFKDKYEFDEHIDKELNDNETNND